MTRAPNQMALSAQHASRRMAHTPCTEVRVEPRDAGAERTARTAALAALEKKAEEVVLVDVHEHASYADFLVICSGQNERQLEAIADAVEKALREEGRRPIGAEGLRGSRWVLLDFGDVVVHVFDPNERAHYDLEGLWADAPATRLAARADTDAVDRAAPPE